MTQPRDTATEYHPSRIPGVGPDDAAAALLAEARQRAEAIIEDSLARAEQLLRPQRPDSGYERVRLAIVDVGDEVRSIRFRLDAIESLLRGGSAASDAAGSATPRTMSATSAVPRWVEPPAAYAPPPTPTPPTPAPPMAPVPPAPAWSPAPVVDETTAATPAPMPAAGFDPAGGAITLRVAPVAGFQSLMRIQDALVRVSGIHEAGVEAYAQGEARLRVHLGDRMAPQQLADGLADLLNRPIRVAATSLPERTIQLTLD